MGSKRRAVVVGALGAASLALTGCSQERVDQWKRAGLPPSGATDRTEPILNLWVGAWIAAMVVGVLTWGLILYAMVRYRRRSDDEVPVQTRYHLPLEALYTLAPFAIVAGFFFHTMSANSKVLDASEPPQHTIVVVGQQWQWTFNYRENPATGKAIAPGVTEGGVYDTGLLNKPAVLYLPLGQTVRFDMESPDVVHSFWVPHFYFKRDVIPGRTSHFQLTPTKLGEFEGKCAELCGIYHTRMTFKVRVVSPADYRKHLQDLARQGNTGMATGGVAANTLPGYVPEGGR